MSKLTPTLKGRTSFRITIGMGSWRRRFVSRDREAHQSALHSPVARSSAPATWRRRGGDGETTGSLVRVIEKNEG